MMLKKLKQYLENKENEKGKGSIDNNQFNKNNSVQLKSLTFMYIFGSIWILQNEVNKIIKNKNLNFLVYKNCGYIFVQRIF